MTKKKISAALLAGLILVSLAGCAEHKEPIQIAPNSTATADGTSDIQLSDDISAKPAVPAESVPDEETAPETGLPTEKEENQPESTSPPDVQTEIPKPSETRPVQTNPPKENEPASTEPVQPPQTEQPKPTESPVTETPKPTEPKPTEPIKPEYTQADYDRIIREAKKYAESYAKKGFAFEWKDSMEFGWDVGYMGTPRIERDGTDGVIKTLKHHIDLIVQTSSDPANGITTDWMTYKVVQIIIDGDIAFAVIYGG